MKFDQDDWVNASELHLAELSDRISQVRLAMSALCDQLAGVSAALEGAKLYQLSLVPKPENGSSVRRDIVERSIARTERLMEEAAQPSPEEEEPKQPRPRQSFRTVVAKMIEEHGEEVATFVLGNMIGTARTVESVQKAMKTFLGTYSSPELAAQAFACNLERADEDPFEVMAMARYRLIHDDGQVSIWSNYLAPGQMAADGEEDAGGAESV